MNDLVAFIRARLDEDEQAAKLVQQPYRLYVSADGRLAEPLRIDDLHGEHDGEYQQWPEGDDRMPNHVTNWSLVYDPAHVLREVEAKRQTIALLAEDAGAASGEVTRQDFGSELGRWTRATAMLRILASVYADHADFREEWRP